MQALSKKAWPARMESLYLSMDFVASCARAHGFGPERIGEIELVMEEILVNIFKYAYEGQETGDVEIACSQDGGSLIIQITDSGVPFDLLAASDPDTTAAIDDRQVGGLGIYFVKQLTDSVRYERDKDRNRLTLVVSRDRKE